jgi:aspartyl-tRNA synthetase
MLYKNRTECGILGTQDIGKTVRLKGWVDALRDHGDLLFIHLRDRSGIVQVVFRNDEYTTPDTYSQAGTLKNEYCVSVEGKVIERHGDTKNPNISTGDIEVVAHDMKILSTSRRIPFPISEKAMVFGDSVKGIESVSEEIRLKYRYLDLRRPSMQENLIKRYHIYRCIRNFLDENGFVEVETPMLTKSTPEGARDYLVPSRIHRHRYYALPQSPQLFKQLLMISGFERYFQIVKCFRDEDLRPNRQPEFTQLDIEASFIDEEFMHEIMEELVVRIFEVAGKTLSHPFPHMSYEDAMNNFGTDRPDLRFGLKICEATDLFRNTSYKIFQNIVNNGGLIKGINVKGGSKRLSKNVLQNEYAKKIVPGFGARGMTWMRVKEGNLESNIVQFFSSKEQKNLIERFGARHGDVLMLVADESRRTVNSVLGQLRGHVAGRLNLIPEGTYSPVWITGFPLFDAAPEGISPNHHPFTLPDITDFDPGDREAVLSLHSRSYDIVINGEELGGGSMRISDSKLQHKIFELLGFSNKEIQERFGFFIRALDYGTPPHGGIALGLDRVVSMTLGTSSIRDIIAFPKNRKAFCPLSEAPSPVSDDQLAELGLINLDST